VGKKKTTGVIAVPDSPGGDPAKRSVDRLDASVVRVILLGEVLFHREALTRALHAYDDITIVGSVADVHAALILAEEKRPHLLIVDSPSDAVARALAAYAVRCKVVFIGAVGDPARQLTKRGAAIFVGATSSLDEIHVAMRFARPGRLPVESTMAPRAIGGAADPALTIREQELRRFVAGGYSNKEIADACGISVATVKNHVHRILGKLNIQRRAQIAGLGGEPPAVVPGRRAVPT
jgi:DNA-binding NarL/FixJ family response regulator